LGGHSNPPSGQRNLGRNFILSTLCSPPPFEFALVEDGRSPSNLPFRKVVRVYVRTAFHPASLSVPSLTWRRPAKRFACIRAVLALACKMDTTALAATTADATAVKHSDEDEQPEQSDR
jgi:hypothetical protein